MTGSGTQAFVNSNLDSPNTILPARKAEDLEGSLEWIQLHLKSYGTSFCPRVESCRLVYKARPAGNVQAL